MQKQEYLSVSLISNNLPDNQMWQRRCYSITSIYIYKKKKKIHAKKKIKFKNRTYAGRGFWHLSQLSVTPERSIPSGVKNIKCFANLFIIYYFFIFLRMSFDAGSWPGYELCWPQAATPSTAWTPGPPPLLPPLLPPAPSPHQPHPLWPMDITPTHLLAALLRSSSINLLTTSQQR